MAGADLRHLPLLWLAKGSSGLNPHGGKGPEGEETAVDDRNGTGPEALEKINEMLTYENAAKA